MSGGIFGWNALLTFFLLLPARLSMGMGIAAGRGGTAADEHKTIREMLSGLIYDQEMRTCCERIRQNGDFALLNCSAIKDGVLPVANGGYANPNYYQYFWNCVSRRSDYTECCKGHGINMECLPICNAKNHPSFEEMNILLAKACFNEMSEILSSCIAIRRGKIRGAEIILHLENGNEV